MAIVEGTATIIAVKAPLIRGGNELQLQDETTCHLASESTNETTAKSKRSRSSSVQNRSCLMKGIIFQHEDLLILIFENLNFFRDHISP